MMLKNNKTLIFVELSFYGKADPINYADYKYFIDIEPEDNFRYVTTRNIDDFRKECKNLKSLMKKETNTDKNIKKYVDFTYSTGSNQMLVFPPSSNTSSPW